LNNMIIKSIEVKNFRSIREARLDCDNLTAIVGRNGAGKSSFLYAIDAFYDIAALITEEDFFNRDMGSTIEIRVTYGDLRDDEKGEFQPYIKDDILIVTKRISSENGRIIQRYYATALQITQFAEIRAKSGKTDRRSAWKELLDSGNLVDLGGTAKNADEVERLMTEYEANHPELMEPVEREEQFFGPRNIGGGKLDKFTKYVLVPAVREASDEASGKKGAIYQILDMVVLRRINAREDVQKFKSEFEERVKELYSPEKLTELSELGNSISQTLEKFAPGSKLNLRWDEAKPPEIPLPPARATLVEDRFEGEITRKGHGLQRALIVTLLQHLAMTVPVESPVENLDEEETGISEPKGIETSQSPDLILAIEEPELYLHPSRCRYLSNLLLQLADRPGTGLGASNQVIYTSHSPYFVDLHRFDQIRLVRKVPSPDSLAQQSVVNRFSLSQAAKELAKVCNADPANFTRNSFRARAMPVMNTIVSEGFFADTVVVVEGLSEVGTLWKLQEIMKKDWSQLGIVVVPAGGKNNIDRPTVIFRGLSIPTYFIFDADSHLIGKRDEKDAINRNHRYLRLAAASIEDFPETQSHETWAVFKDNLEGIFKESLGSDIFQAILKKVASELGYDDLDRVSKNIEGAAGLIELIYENKYKIPELEKIIEKVTQLRNG
jgi:putative ATP-dependent endonuclease of the OLD family